MRKTKGKSEVNVSLICVSVTVTKMCGSHNCVVVQLRKQGTVIIYDLHGLIHP